MEPASLRPQPHGGEASERAALEVSARPPPLGQVGPWGCILFISYGVDLRKVIIFDEHKGLTSPGGRIFIIHPFTPAADVSRSRCWGFRPRGSQMDEAQVLGQGET